LRDGGPPFASGCAASPQHRTATAQQTAPAQACRRSLRPPVRASPPNRNNRRVFLLRLCRRECQHRGPEYVAPTKPIESEEGLATGTPPPTKDARPPTARSSVTAPSRWLNAPCPWARLVTSQTSRRASRPAMRVRIAAVCGWTDCGPDDCSRKLRRLPRGTSAGAAGRFTRLPTESIGGRWCVQIWRVQVRAHGGKAQKGSAAQVIPTQRSSSFRDRIVTGCGFVPRG